MRGGGDDGRGRVGESAVVWAADGCGGRDRDVDDGPGGLEEVEDDRGEEGDEELRDLSGEKGEDGG